MKPKLILILSICILTLVGCGTSYRDAVTKQETQNAYTEINEDYFTTIIEWSKGTDNYEIVYANDTNVKYLIIHSGYHYGITPLYNNDGSLQIYETEVESNNENEEASP